MAKDRLVTPSYCCILAANFLLYFGFYLLMPVLPFYLTEVFHTGNTMVGIALSCYTVAALTIRPFSGYLLDTLARKPLYLISFFIFTTIFAGYLFAGSLTLFIILRIVHGFAFGTVTVSGNTVVIDIMPSSRRGEGIGYYGLTNNTAMAIGPMVGLFLHDFYSFPVIFLSALTSCSLGWIMASLVRTPPKEPVKRAPVSLDRFILIVSDKDTRDPDFMYHFFQPAPQFVTHLRIDRRKRFIQKQKCRIRRKRPRKRDTLSLSARELIRIALFHTGQPGQFDQFRHPLFDLFLRNL